MAYIWTNKASPVARAWKEVTYRDSDGGELTVTTILVLRSDSTTLRKVVVRNKDFNIESSGYRIFKKRSLAPDEWVRSYEQQGYTVEYF